MPGRRFSLPGGRRLVLGWKSWGTAPHPLNPGAIRGTLRDPEGFGHIGWMIRSFGVFGAAARFPPPGFSIFWGSGE